jgi:hypothetical protein
MAPRLLTTLLAERLLTKTFYKDGRAEPYPLIRDFSSLTVQYESIEDMLEIIVATAEAGGCLLKGHLTKQLVSESRAGLGDTNANTDWLVLDYDSDGGFESISDLLEEIDPALNEVDYIFQHSASSGINGESGIRGHIFFMLETPVAPSVLKQWVRKVNLISTRFRDRVKLSRNAMALCFALDPTVNQNDKLIYVAPPVLIGLDDPVGQRFSLHKQANRYYKFTASISAEYNRAREIELLNHLQDQMGIQKRTPKYSSVGDLEILSNPGECTVTGVKKSDVYTRINLNGGDSWAYWHYTDNPEILYNYKGEPATYLKDVAPTYYQQLQLAEERKTIRPFVFRDINRDLYYNAEYDETNGHVVMCQAVSRRQTLADFMIQRGSPAPKVIPDWEMKFDPTDPMTVDFQNKRLNTFAPTRYMRMQVDMSNVPTESDFPTIAKVVKHICVTPDVYIHFMKWIAHILQFRTKTQTAWLFSGIEGTGKGVMFSKILRPIIGERYSQLINQDNLEDQFNGYVETSILLFVDEGDIEGSKAAEKVMGKLRTTITEATLPIRNMRQNMIEVPNFTNVIVATNRSMAVKLQESDRRWNIAPRQHTKIELSYEEIFTDIPRELEAFTKYLLALQIEATDSIKLIETESREALLELSRTVADEFFGAIKAGNLDFLAERLQETVPVPENGYIAFAAVVQKWMQNAVDQVETEAPVDDLVTVYKYISGNGDITSKRFGHLSSRHELRAKQKRIRGIQRRVFSLKFEDRGYAIWLQRNKRPGVSKMNLPHGADKEVVSDER